MTEFNALDDSGDWQKDFERRLTASLLAAGLGDAATRRTVEEARGKHGSWTVAGITDAGTRVGHVAVSVEDDDGVPTGRIGDLRVEADHAGRGYEEAARDWAEAWCAERGAGRVDIRITEPVGGLFDGYGVRGQLRARRIDSPPEPVDGVTARPMTPAEYPEWLAAEKLAYVDDIVRSGLRAPRRPHASPTTTSRS